MKKLFRIHFAAIAVSDLLLLAIFISNNNPSFEWILLSGFIFILAQALLLSRLVLRLKHYFAEIYPQINKKIRFYYLGILTIDFLLFTLLALITGAIWGKPMWGTWWVWDARLTAELILFFLYLGVLAIYSAFQDRNVGAKAASVLCVVGVVNLPIIHFSVEWWNTLHQGASITKLERPSIATPMLIPLILCIFGFLTLSIWLTLVRYRTELLKEDSKRPWVKALAEKS